MSGDTATAMHGRRARLRAIAAARGVPLATILVTVAVVVITYLAGKAELDAQIVALYASATQLSQLTAPAPGPAPVPGKTASLRRRA